MLLKNSTIVIFSEVCNLRASLPQFSAYFLPWSSLKLYIFYHQVFFAIERILKEQYHRISSLCFFLESTPYEPLSHTLNYFRIWFKSADIFKFKSCSCVLIPQRNLFRWVWYLQKFVRGMIPRRNLFTGVWYPAGLLMTDSVESWHRVLRAC
jgi:hypothetical protein